jgi:hypothetical protein
MYKIDILTNRRARMPTTGDDIKPSDDITPFDGILELA